MRTGLIIALRRRRALAGQLLAAFFVLQALAGVVAADIAARDPLVRYALSELCSPGSRAPLLPERPGAEHLCVLCGPACSMGGCAAAGPAVIAVLHAPPPRVAPPAADAAPRLAAAPPFAWPNPTGPPAAA